MSRSTETNGNHRCISVFIAGRTTQRQKCTDTPRISKSTKCVEFQTFALQSEVREKCTSTTDCEKSQTFRQTSEFANSESVDGAFGGLCPPLGITKHYHMVLLWINPKGAVLHQQMLRMAQVTEYRYSLHYSLITVSKGKWVGFSPNPLIFFAKSLKESLFAIIGVITGKHSTHNFHGVVINVVDFCKGKCCFVVMPSLEHD